MAAQSAPRNIPRVVRLHFSMTTHHLEFAPTTTPGNDQHPPTYRRRNNGRFVQKQGPPPHKLIQLNELGVVLTNRHVVPYNIWALLRYRAHINVEIVSSIKAIKSDSSTLFLTLIN